MDKKEKRDQKDPEKELADSALQPYRRPYVTIDFLSSDTSVKYSSSNVLIVTSYYYLYCFHIMAVFYPWFLLLHMFCKRNGIPVNHCCQSTEGNTKH